LLKLSTKLIITLLALTFFPIQAEQSPLDQYFENKLTHLNQLLIKNKHLLKSDPKELESFVNVQILPIWSSSSTLKALLTTKNWNKTPLDKQTKLINAFNQTLHRYVREGMKFYDEQNFTFLSTKQNKKGNRGHLTILIEPELLPSINVTFKMAKIEGNWKLYDVLVTGISYVKMKKLEIGRIYSEDGVDGVLEHLHSKNLILDK